MTQPLRRGETSVHGVCCDGGEAEKLTIDIGSPASEDPDVVNRRVQREHEDALLFYVGELGAVYVKDLQTLFFGDRYPGAPWELYEARFPPAPLRLSPSAVHRLCQRLQCDGRLRLTPRPQPQGRPRLVATLGEEALLRSRRLRARRHLLADIATQEAFEAALARAALRTQLMARASAPTAGVGRDGLALMQLRRALIQLPFEMSERDVDAALRSPTVAFFEGGRGLVREHYRCTACGYEGAFRQVHQAADRALCEGRLEAFLPSPIEVAYGLSGRASIAVLLVDDGEQSLPALVGPLAFLSAARRPVDVLVAESAGRELLPTREPGRTRWDALARVGRELAGVNVVRYAARRVRIRV